MRLIVIVTALAAALLSPAACTKKSGEPGSTGQTTSAGGLIIETVKVGDGAIATQGKTVAVHYTGRLTDGTKFDSSLDR